MVSVDRHQRLNVSCFYGRGRVMNVIVALAAPSRPCRKPCNTRARPRDLSRRCQNRALAVSERENSGSNLADRRIWKALQDISGPPMPKGVVELSLGSELTMVDGVVVTEHHC
jgi:hypothetical protein